MAATVGNLVRRLLEFLDLHEARHHPIAHELQKLKKPLEDLQGFLHDAEWQRDLGEGKKDARSEQISSWVHSTSRLAAEVEEIIVTCDLYLLNMNISTGSFSKAYHFLRYVVDIEKDTVINKIKRFLSSDSQSNSTLVNLAPVVQITDKSILDFYLPTQRVLFDELALLMEEFSLNVINKVKKLIWDAIGMQFVIDMSVRVTPTMLSHEPENATRTILESVKLLGRQEEVKQLKNWLTEEQTEADPMVIGVTGPGGIGKTTLASEVYKQMQRNFDYHAWIFTSGNPTSLLEDMLTSILKSISVAAPSNMESMDSTTIIKIIRYWLSRKTLFLILDHVATERELSIVRECLPGDCRAKILVTSRDPIRGCDRVLNLQTLKAQDAFHLLRKRTGLDNQRSSFWPSVEKESGKILKFCRGLPLAIVTIGGLLSTKQMETKEWTKVYEMLRKANYLSLCYADLDPVLKSCFLYAASFPSHAVIPCKRLERLWIAEGFVTIRSSMMVEEVAKLQLHELIQRNFIQIARVGKDGEVEMCRLLKPMRAFALKRAEQDKFSMAVEGGGNLMWKRPHRLFLHIQHSDHHMVNNKELINTRLYSLLEFEGNQYLHTSLNLSRDFKLLCVLDLHHLQSGTLPEAIGNLVLLKYLGLRNTKLLKLPKSLKQLRRLQTLDIRETLVKELPAGVEVLNKMKHLLLAGSFSEESVNIKGDIQFFNDLLALSGVKLTENIAEQLQHLSKLQKLSVGEVKRRHSKSLSEAIDKMEDLRSLTVNCNPAEKIYINTGKDLSSLEKLKIGGQVSNLLDWVPKLRTLKYLYLWENYLSDDPFPSLQNLPNLVLLSLCNTYKGEEIQIGTTGFPNLKKLSILYCNGLKRWVHKRGGALRNLEELTIGYCPKLMVIPQGLEELTSLVILELANMPTKFVEEAKAQHSKSKFSILVRDTSQLSSRGIENPKQLRFPALAPIDKAKNYSNGVGKSKTS